MWKGQGRSGYGESSTGGDYDDWSCLSRNGRQWKSPTTMLTRDLSGADYWHIRKQMTDSYDVPLEVYAENDTVNLAHTLPNGKANLLAYADRPTAVKSKVSIKDKILPQGKRLTVLRNQMIELENSYRSGEMDISEYSILRDVLVTKLQRQEVLYKRAISAKPIKTEDEYEEVEAETLYQTHEVAYTDIPIATSNWLDDFIAELPDRNCFKNFLKMSCKVMRKTLHYKHKAATYLNTLKEV
jgi:hypothetical protein